MSSKRLISCLSKMVKHNLTIQSVHNYCNIQIRHASIYDMKKVEDVKDFTTKFELTKDPEDWKYVERVLAPLVVPEPQIKSEYFSGWKPPSDKLPSDKYFVQRSKNFMIPVYLYISHRGTRRVTKIRKIQGDVFGLERDIKNHLEKVLGQAVATQGNELVGYINIKGDHVNLVKKYLTDKGF